MKAVLYKKEEGITPFLQMYLTLYAVRRTC